MTEAKDAFRKGFNEAMKVKASIADIVRARSDLPDRILLMGVEGVGKSQFGAEAPKPVFIAAEEGLGHLAETHDLQKFPEPETWRHLLAQVDALINEEHDFETLVIDTLDWVEPLIWDYLCQIKNWKDIEAPGYGKGYNLAVPEFRRLFSKLDELREKRTMRIIVLAHTSIMTFSDPTTGADYNRYEPSVNRKAGNVAKQWADFVLFGQFETWAIEEKQRMVGVSSGRRVLYTQRCAAYDAKARYPLPEEIPLQWSAFDAARKAVNENNGALDDEISSLVARLAPTLSKENKKKLDEWIEKATTPYKKRSAIDALRNRLTQEGIEA